jgi:putative membrane protein
MRGAATSTGRDSRLQRKSRIMSELRSPAPAAIAPRLASQPALTSALVYAAIALAGIMLRWLCRAHSLMLPVWAPWEFSWVEFLAAWLTIWWYLRGLARTAPDERPSLMRQVAFFAGMLTIYAVLETRFEYFAEHQFYINRMQHVAMHHLGPVMLALAWPGATLMRGMPAPLRRLVENRFLVGIVYVLQQPVLAAVLFVGLIFFWLIPSVHFAAMINPNRFALMNWSMVVDGILFWCLVLDPRASPPARASFGARAAMVVLVMFPQIIGGALITFNPRDIYSFYDLCGRIYPEWGAHYDQALGGIIIWIPPAMMSIGGLLLVLNILRRVEEKQFADFVDDDPARPVIDSSQWTG